MGRTACLLASVVLTAASLFAEGPQIETLPAEGKQIVDYLLRDWKLPMRSTSIPLAMKNLGIGPDDDLRFQVGEYLRENTQLAKSLNWWGANNYILSNGEKLIAKHLINTYNARRQMPRLAELTDTLAAPQQELKERLKFMARVGLLRDSATEDLGYTLADGYARWGGPLRHNFHTVYVEGEKPFNVW